MWTHITQSINIHSFLYLLWVHSSPLHVMVPHTHTHTHTHTPHQCELVSSTCFSLQDILIQTDQGSPGARPVKPYSSLPAFHSTNEYSYCCVDFNLSSQPPRKTSTFTGHTHTHTYTRTHTHTRFFFLLLLCFTFFSFAVIVADFYIMANIIYKAWFYSDV